MLAALATDPAALLLPVGASLTPTPLPEGEGVAGVEYRRPSSDRIEVDVTAPTAGYVRVLEAWDPGWSARVDGADATVLTASTFAIAVPVSAGQHRVQLDYATPGRLSGLYASLTALALLAALLRWTPGGARLSRSPTASTSH